MLVRQRDGGVLASPLSRLNELSREMDRLFDGMWPDGWTQYTSNWVPPMDVQETSEEIRCMIEVPGLRSEDIDISVERDLLTVSGEKRVEHEAEGVEYRFSERRYGRFSRTLRLPNTVDPDNVTAHYDNGILTITLPKAEEAKARKIKIDGAPSGRRIEGKVES